MVRSKTWRALRIARRSAVKARTQAALQIRDLILTAPDELTTINGADLRHRREHADLTLADAANALNTWPIAISRLERGITHNTDLSTRYNHWLHHAA